LTVQSWTAPPAKLRPQQFPSEVASLCPVAGSWEKPQTSTTGLRYLASNIPVDAEWGIHPVLWDGWDHVGTLVADQWQAGRQPAATT